MTWVPLYTPKYSTTYVGSPKSGPIFRNPHMKRSVRGLFSGMGDAAGGTVGLIFSLIIICVTLPLGSPSDVVSGFGCGV